ncbi:hypothetical protein [Fundidesulfovibrio soli]|uniref:hypothetical protein n=1 Tax=Fundidesulfovibrio soli TaxID=2922716 RepID=UPI001FAFE4B7|nr:hypothetical protein [Fundidesulfovibrio soli]
MRSTGILFSASGEHYIEEANKAINTSLKHNECQHALFCDIEPQHKHDGVIYKIFNPAETPYADKLHSCLTTPFEKTIYLDSDIHVIRPITNLFDVLDRFDIAIAHAPGYRGLEDPDVPEAFYEFNTGVIAYRANTAIRNLFRKTIDTYLSWRADPPRLYYDEHGTLNRKKLEYLADQPAFRNCLWNSNVRICTLGPEYNYRATKPGFAVAAIRTIHGRLENITQASTILNDKLGPRIFQQFPLAQGIDEFRSRWHDQNKCNNT